MVELNRQEARKSIWLALKDSRTDQINRIVFPEDVQIGLPGEPGELVLTGRVSVPTRNITIDPTINASCSASMTNDDCVLCVTTSNTQTPCTIVLPPLPRDGQIVFVSDSGGYSSSDNISIVPGNPSSQTIDGSSSVVIQIDHGSVGICWSGEEWHTITSAPTSGSGGGGGAPTNAKYVVMALNGTLTDERVLTAGSGIKLSDGGAGGNASLSIDNNIVATVSGTTFVGGTVHTSGITGSIQKLVDGSSYIIAGSNVTVVSGSNGSITISSSETDRRTDMSAELLWYKCNETTSSLSNSGTAGSFDLTQHLTGSFFGVPDLFGDSYGAVSADCVSSVITTTVLPNSQSASIWSVIRLGYPSAGRIWGLSRSSDDGSLFELYMGSQVPIVWYRLVGSAPAHNVTGGNNSYISQGQVSLLGATYDGTAMKLYLNGYLVANSVDPGALDFSALDLRWLIGHSYTTYDGIYGHILDVGCASRVMTAAEFKTMYTKIVYGQLIPA